MPKDKQDKLEERVLTNGGKPHVCYEIAVHNTRATDRICLCPACFMPVDSLDFKEKKPRIETEADLLLYERAFEDGYATAKRIYDKAPIKTVEENNPITI